MSVKITSLEVENVKRVRAVALAPDQNGLTIIGGKNGQGKTSVLDAIAWALGGDKYRPSGAQREGSTIPPLLHVELSNGLIVERRGKNSDLKVIDPNGNKGGQTLLNEFIEQLALDLPRFMQSSSKEKANTLLKIIGVGDQLYKLEQQEQTLYNQRHAIGQIADQKKKYAAELPEYPDAPKEPVSASELIRQQQEILARNGENQRKRDRLDAITAQYHQLCSEIGDLNVIMLSSGHIKEVGTRHRRTPILDVIYYSSGSTAECCDMAHQIVVILQSISTPEGDTLNCTACDWSIEDGVLHIRVGYDHFVYTPIEPDHMETLQIQQEG